MAEKETQNESSRRTVRYSDTQPSIKVIDSPQQTNPTTTPTTKESTSSGLNSLSTQNRSIVSYAPSNQITSKSVIEPANKSSYKTISPNLDNIVNNADSTSQLRSTLAIGQLIASNRPTAGSRLIASELRQLTKTIAEESSVLRKEIANLSASLSESLKSVTDEDREHRSIARAFYRRPMFAQLARKSFPSYHQRRGRGGYKEANATLVDVSTTTPMSPRSSPGKNTANKTDSPNNANKRATSARDRVPAPRPALKLTSLSAKLVNPAKALGALFKNGWFPPERVFIATTDSDTDTDSTDTNPSSSP